MKFSKTGLGCAAAFAILLTVGPAQSQAPAPSFVVAYLEAPATGAAVLAGKLKAYAEALRKGPGAPSVEILRETSRPSRMAVVEHWPSAPPMSEEKLGEALQAKVEGAVQAPADLRVNIPMTPPITPPPRAAVQILIHVDVIPPGTKDANMWLTQLRTAVLAAPGALGYEVAYQPEHPNHFAVHEAWASRAAYEAFLASAPAEDLRQKLVPVKGALFDDRFYAVEP